MTHPTLLLFPGLGVDARVFGPQRSLPFPIEVAEWVEPLTSDETLTAYARRMARMLGPRPGCYVGGISLGAMVALEAARELQAAGIFAIGGCASHRQIASLFRTALAASAHLPTAAVRPILSLAAPTLRLIDQLPPEPAQLMMRMMKEHSRRQIIWSCGAIEGWECSVASLGIPVHAIHGEKDAVIPVSGVTPRQVVAGGHHLINLTHAAEVNAFIATRILAERRGSGG